VFLESLTRCEEAVAKRQAAPDGHTLRQDCYRQYLACESERLYQCLITFVAIFDHVKDKTQIDDVARQPRRIRGEVRVPASRHKAFACQSVDIVALPTSVVKDRPRFTK